MSSYRVAPDYYSYASNDVVVSDDLDPLFNRSIIEQYDVTERDSDAYHNEFRYIPSAYGSTYDVSQYNEGPVFYGDDSLGLPRPIYTEQYYHDYDDPYVVDDLPMFSSYGHTLSSSEPPQLIRRTIYDAVSPDPPSPSPSPVQVIYEGDYRPENEEIIEYVVKEPPAKPIVRFSCLFVISPSLSLIRVDH